MRSNLLAVLIVSILAWGALAFGAVYPWAYWPLCIACGAAGVVGLARARKDRRRLTAVAIALIVLATAVLLQLVPLPREALSRISPKSDALLTSYDLRYAAIGSRFGSSATGWLSRVHGLSIDPPRTARALALLIAFELMLFGLAKRIDRKILIVLVRAILVLGAGMAVFGIIQQANYSGKIYGFWIPHQKGALAPFGPFVNRNHFAGWMLMAVPIGFGYLLGLIAQATRDVKMSWRDRLLWLSTPAATALILTAFALTAMVMSVLFSLSRSGILCLIVSLIGLGLLAIRRLASLAGSSIAAAFLALVLILAIGWAGTDRIALRFDEFRSEGLGGRAYVWSDAWRIARAYPLAGTGLGTFGVGMIFYQTLDMNKRYLEAHNDYLQLAAEGGWLLTIPALLLLAILIREVRRRFSEGLDDEPTYWIRAGAVIGLLTIALQAVSDFSLQMPGNAAMFCVLVAIALHRSWDILGAGRVRRAERS